MKLVQFVNKHGIPIIQVNKDITEKEILIFISTDEFSS